MLEHLCRTFVSAADNRITRLFVTLLFFPQLIYTLTKVLYQYINNIGRLQHRLPKGALMCSASMRASFAPQPWFRNVPDEVKTWGYTHRRLTASIHSEPS